MNAFEILQERGFVAQHTAGLPELLGREKVVFYAGFDPTASSLHVGHLLPVMAAAHLQRAGHKPILVVGGGTAMVGDPTGKDEMRQLLTEVDIEQNKVGIREQLGRVIDLSPGSGLMVDNADWLMGLGYIQFLRDIGRHFSVNAMLAKASVKLRMEKEKGLSFIEFNYQILQAYDFLELFRRFGCVLQVGGDDQWGNITAGMDLVRRLTGAEAHALTFPLLTTAAGTKMGKTAAGAVWLDAERLSPYDYFQYWVNVDDADVGRLLRFFTFLPMDQIRELDKLQGADIREAKRVLALEATALVHGRAEAERALAGALAAFSGGGAIDAMPQFVTGLPKSILDILVESGLCKSRSEARRQIGGGAVRVGDEKVANEAVVLEQDGAVVWVGRKSAVRVVRG